MKRKVLLLLLCCLSIFCFAQNENTEESLLVLANKYYDSENYESAKDCYIKTISEGTYNGTIFYRLGYCLESIGDNESLMKKCYEASYYCFNKDSETDNSYYEKAGKKLKQYGLNNEITESDLQNTIAIIVPSKLLEFAKHFWFIFLAVGIIIYIVAYKLSENTSCVIVYGWKDFIIIALGVFFLFITKDDILQKDYTMLFIPMVFFAISALFSIIGNIRGSASDGFLKDLLFTLASLITKFVLLVVVPIIIFCGLLAATSGEKDKRYKDGTKNNARTANIALFSAIAAFLFEPLIKTKRDL